MTRGTRIALIAALVVAAVVAFIIVNPGGGDDNPNNNTSSTTSSKKTAPSVTAIKVVGGKPAGGITTITVHKGDRVRFIPA